MLPFLCKRLQTVCRDQQSTILFKMIKTMKALLRDMFWGGGGGGVGGVVYLL